ncbi:hypothetical protein CAEBREN_15175 [Caenorhabditis brenneri]|uniref:F-box domain-containing protein n=1 Tax=Caenorhabditis brenneri TaxID=135651 RepID=G0P0R6_CAEBE|nr:hypothetical protein CAEBREN_15175 [Caenorhabditis brenneri]
MQHQYGIPTPKSEYIRIRITDENYYCNEENCDEFFILGEKGEIQDHYELVHGWKNIQLSDFTFFVTNGKQETEITHAELLEWVKDKARGGIFESIQKQRQDRKPTKDDIQEMKKLSKEMKKTPCTYPTTKANENYDLNHDKNSDPKTRGFLEIPIDVVEKIIGKLGLVDRFGDCFPYRWVWELFWVWELLSVDVVDHILKNLGLVDKLSTRQVCRELRALVDKQISSFQYVYLYIRPGTCSIRIQSGGILYYKEDNLKKTLKNFSTFITNPNWKFENLSINFFKNTDEAVLLLDSMLANYQIHVKNITIYEPTLKPMVTLLPRLQPNVLESIDFEFEENKQDLMKKIMKMDQWKNAKKLNLTNITHGFTIENMFHFKEFRIEEMNITDEYLVKIRDILFKSPTFEFCSLWGSSGGDHPEVDDGEVDEELDELEQSVNKVMKQHAAYDASTKQYRVSKDYYFQIDLGRFMGFLNLVILKEKSN